MVAQGRQWVGTVGPFWTTSGTRWDQNPGHAPQLFESLAAREQRGHFRLTKPRVLRPAVQAIAHKLDGRNL